MTQKPHKTHLNLVGQRFGTRTVVARGENFPSKGARWVLRCDCGNESLVGTGEVRKMRRCHQCSWHVKEDLTGQVIGKRTVLGFSHRGSQYRVYWKVRCDCGNEYTSEIQYIRKHKNEPCRKCSPGLKATRPHKRKRPYEAQYNAWLGHARYPVSITYEEFLEFTKIPECHYCGAPVVWMEYGLKGVKKSTASNLDRKDSTKPYDLNNVVVCCRRCNMGKNTLFSYEEWKEIGDVIRSWGLRDVPYFTGYDSRRENNWRKKKQETKNGNDIQNQG